MPYGSRWRYFFIVITVIVMTLPVLLLARLLETDNSSVMIAIFALILAGIIFSITQSKVDSKITAYLIFLAVSSVCYTSIFSTNFRNASLLACLVLALHIAGFKLGVNAIFS